MIGHIAALSLSLALYMFIGISYFGWGQILLYILRVNNQQNHPKLSLVWIGWAITLFLFQILHLFFPLSLYVVTPIFIIGVIFSFKQGAIKLRSCSQKSVSILKISLIIFVTSASAVWIASRSMLSPTNYDSGLYHFNAIKWINTFSIVPGLGNLHGRLAFNQSFFLYVASLNFYPLFQNGHSIANSFLILLTFATLFYYLSPAIKDPSILITSHPFKFLPALFTLPIMALLTLTSDGLASPSPDLSSTLLQLVIFVIFVFSLNEWQEEQKIPKCSTIVLIILSTTLITIKLSNLMYAISIIAIIFVYSLKTANNLRNKTPRIIALTALMLLVWTLRGYLLSGAPLYPSTIGYIPLEWAVPKDAIVDLANWVYSWARQPNTHWSNVLGSWDWFIPWLTRNSRILTLLNFPVFFSTIAYLTLRIFMYRKKSHTLKLYEVILLCPLVFSLLYWFFTAPDIRFANAIFFLFGVSLIILFLENIQKIVNRKWYVLFLFVTFFLGNISYGYIAIANKHELTNISLSGYQQVKEVPLYKKVTSAGMRVYVPVTGDQCWDSPLPCTPDFTPSLEMRKLRNLNSVLFMIEY